MASYREVDVLERMFNSGHAHDAFCHIATVDEADHDMALAIDYDYQTDDKGRVVGMFRAGDQ